MAIVSKVVPGGILSHRSSLELFPAASLERNNFTIFVTSTYSKQVVIGPLIIKITPGDVTNFTELLVPGLGRSNETRALLENLSNARKREGVVKNLSRTEI